MALNTTISIPPPSTPLLAPDGKSISDPWYRIIRALVLRGGGKPGIDVGSLSEVVQGLQQTITEGRFIVEEKGSGLPAALQLECAAPISITFDLDNGVARIMLDVPLAIQYGGTGADGAEGARVNLGLGTMATQNADAVAISGGEVAGVKVTGATIDASDIGTQRPANGAFSQLTNGDSVLIRTSADLANGAAAQTATLTNAPVAGNPSKWLEIDDNGVTRHIPAW